jgi:hypothetical protein
MMMLAVSGQWYKTPEWRMHWWHAGVYEFYVVYGYFDDPKIKVFMSKISVLSVNCAEITCLPITDQDGMPLSVETLNKLWNDDWQEKLAVHSGSGLPQIA